MTLAAAFLHVLHFGIVRPARVLRARHAGHSASQIRLPYYRRGVIASIEAAAISLALLLFIPRHQGFELFGSTYLVQTGLPSAPAIIIGLVVCLALSVIDVLYTRHQLRQKVPHFEFQTPESTEEQQRWVALSFAAGIGEEITWRWVQPLAVLTVTGNAAIALLASALPFGVGHIRSGYTWALLTVAIACVMHALTFALPGGLYLAMAAHVGQNLSVGLFSRPRPS